MHYDVVIIGAGMSGLAAGIRLAYFDRRVLIVEKHYAFGGLNSYYRLDGREFDVGLHAVTNYTPPGVRTSPLARLLRQLRLSHDDFDLRPQRWSEVRFPEARLRFSNDPALLMSDVVERFPQEADRFRRFWNELQAYEDARLDHPYRPARPILADRLHDPLLVDMLLCPVMYYGSAEAHDMDFSQFVTIFKSLFCEGMARPPAGVRQVVRTLVKKYRGCGGRLKMSCGVERIEVDGDRVKRLVLEDGEEISADVVLSSAGFVETMRLCRPGMVAESEETPGAFSFVETIGILDKPVSALGHEPTIVFFNDAARFEYGCPKEPVDLRSGVVCCPGNYEGHDHMTEGVLRVTWLANPGRWLSLDEQDYRRAKAVYHAHFLERGSRYVPGFGDRLVYSDMFTPRTVLRYTGHLNGAVYGSPIKRRDGRTPLSNLFLIGTDQGFLGIIGAMWSGVTMANVHVLHQT